MNQHAHAVDGFHETFAKLQSVNKEISGIARQSVADCARLNAENEKLRALLQEIWDADLAMTFSMMESIRNALKG